MSKEFNIDNYRYVEQHIGFSEWLQAYKPQPNHINPQARLSGLLYEHDGPEWDHIVQLPVHQFWTVYDDNGTLMIRNGYQVRGRIGYVVTHSMHNAHATVMIDGLTQEMLDHRLGSEEH
jgi:hypothetical protein